MRNVSELSDCQTEPKAKQYGMNEYKFVIVSTFTAFTKSSMMNRMDIGLSKRPSANEISV